MEKNATSTEAQKIPVVGFGRRLAAALIDGLIILFVSFALSLAIIIVWGYLNTYARNEPPSVDRVVVICGLILSFFYYVGSGRNRDKPLPKAF